MSFSDSQFERGLHVNRTAQVLGGIALGIAIAFSPLARADVDVKAAKALMKRNDCSKCHAPDKTKKGPSLAKIAAKYKGKEAEGELNMMKNMTSNPMVKLEDGTEQEHKSPDTKDEATLKNIVKYILSH